MNKLAKRLLPENVGHAIHRRVRRIGVPYDNIFHCCSWKSASQWFVQLFSHPHVMEYSGMGVMTLGRRFSELKKQRVVDFARPDDVRRLLREKAPATFAYPPKTIATTLYYSYEEFLNLPLPRDYRVFFVMRDPRDLVVSYYFSMRNSHVEHCWVKEIRQQLVRRDKDAGLDLVIEHLATEGLYEILRSWNRGIHKNRQARMFSFENLADDHGQFIRELFNWLGIGIPDGKLNAVIADTAFSKISGRPKGHENVKSHQRKGVAGDWVNHLNDQHLERLERFSSSLVQELQYKM